MESSQGKSDYKGVVIPRQNSNLLGIFCLSEKVNSARKLKFHTED